MLIRILPFLVLVTAASATHAMYRCQDGSSVTYTDSPCASGTSSDIRDKVKDQVLPADANEARQRLARQQQFLGQASAEQLKEQQSAERLQKKEALARAARDRRCADLALRRKWAQEDAELATMRTKAAAQRKAVRAGERYDISCKN